MEGETIEHATLTSDRINGDGDAERLETDLGALNGVRDVNVSPDSHSLDVAFDPREVSLDRILEVMGDAGYTGTNTDFAAQRDNPAGSPG